MIGKGATLRDIVLEDQPCPVDDLYCDEELPADSEEEEAEQETQYLAPYRIQAHCGNCERAIRLVVLSTQAGIRSLERLLLTCLDLCCPDCASRRWSFGRTEHGG
ncbi:E7 [Canis familiaris papillomavirus 14]|uniref:Protein E7 n=1 Tax=Canis familiaris papillomavirus 14 TaxID=1236767 RepID=K7QIS7_9PAPI|nr:E7 [Canis familiaris papillomavirus 14]AFU07676.1 E7 [Canis familiaris papillomavirus 14]